MLTFIVEVCLPVAAAKTAVITTIVTTNKNKNNISDNNEPAKLCNVCVQLLICLCSVFSV
jgi:hypothetical protein